MASVSILRPLTFSPDGLIIQDGMDGTINPQDVVNAFNALVMIRHRLERDLDARYEEIDEYRVALNAAKKENRR